MVYQDVLEDNVLSFFENIWGLSWIFLPDYVSIPAANNTSMYFMDLGVQVVD